MHRYESTGLPLDAGTVVVVGIPWDRNASFMTGAAQAPKYIREALNAGSMNLCTEKGIDLAGVDRLLDLGDLADRPGESIYDQVEARISGLLDQGAKVLALGGDHSITFPILRAFKNKFNKLNLLHLDAHPDLYDRYDNNPLSHASPFARIMESRLVDRLVQIGIRTMNPAQQAQTERFGVEVIDMCRWRPDLNLDFQGPLYLSVDLDVLDPAYAPGVSHQEPGGLTTRELLTLIQGLQAPVVGADIVELNPTQDPTGITIMAAAKLFKEIAGAMLTDAPIW